MSWIWAALTPHPPVIIPQVGKGREKTAQATLDGFSRLNAAIKALDTPRPDCLLVLSPHHPYAPGSLLLNNNPALSGNLTPFGAPEVSLQLKTDGQALQKLAAHLKKHSIPVALGGSAEITSDHGTLVPLAMLSPAFDGDLPPVIIAGPIGIDAEMSFNLGKALASFDPDGRYALLASGDLSHKLLRDGPYGYVPEGPMFDAAVTKALELGDPGILLNLSMPVLYNSAECGLRSILAMLGLIGSPAEVFSYEGPFGVGYCTAFWSQTTDVKEKHHETHPYPSLARLTVKQFLTGKDDGIDRTIQGAYEELWNKSKACFVSIKTKSGELRGCIGTFMPTKEHISQEIMANSVSAATKDPRFPPMTVEELDNVTFSVDVLSTPEDVSDINELDPAIWGIIITQGNRRGLLLPDLPGVDTVQKQISIAAQKAGIRDLNGVRIMRFTVDRYPE